MSVERGKKEEKNKKKTKKLRENVEVNKNPKTQLFSYLPVL